MLSATREGASCGSTWPTGTARAATSRQATPVAAAVRTGAGRGPACGLLSPSSRAGSAWTVRAEKISRPARIGAATVHQGPPVGCCSAGTSREEASSNPVGVCQPRSMNIRSSARVIRAISTITTTVPRAPTTMGASPEASSLTAAGKISAWARMIPTGPASRLTRFWVSWITSTTRAITTTCSSGTMGAGRTTRRSTAPAMSTGRAAAAVRRNQEEPANRPDSGAEASRIATASSASRSMMWRPARGGRPAAAGRVAGADGSVRADGGIGIAGRVAEPSRLAEPSRVAESNRIAGASRGARSDGADGAVGRDQQVREIVGGGAAHQGPAAQARTGGGRGLDRVGVGPGAPLGAGAAHGGAEVLPVARSGAAGPEAPDPLPAGDGPRACRPVRVRPGGGGAEGDGGAVGGAPGETVQLETLEG